MSTQAGEGNKSQHPIGRSAGSEHGDVALKGYMCNDDTRDADSQHAFEHIEKQRCGGYFRSCNAKCVRSADVARSGISDIAVAG